MTAPAAAPAWAGLVPVLDALGVPAVLTDAAGEVVAANAAALALLERGDRRARGEVAAALRGEEGAWQAVPASGGGWPRLVALRGMAGRAAWQAERRGRVWRLTARQREALAFLAEGLSNREVARRMGVSEHTVESHVGAILGRAGAESRAALVARFWSDG